MPPRKNNTLNVPTPFIAQDVTPSVENILSVFNQATADEIDEGTRWYAEAYLLATTLDPSNPSRAAGVIAALSPITPWERNKTLAIRAYRDGIATGTLGANCAKANRILGDEDPLDVLSGDKVLNFYLSILGYYGACCVDRHAFDVAVGQVTNDVTRRILSRKGYYEHIASLYRSAARHTGYTASEIQAITWITFRRLKGL